MRLSGDREPSRLGNRWLAAALFLGTLAIASLAAGAYAEFANQRSAAVVLEQAMKLIAGGNRLEAHLETLGSEARGYILSRSADSPPFTAIEKQIDDDLDGLIAIESADPAAQAMIEHLRPLAAERVAAIRNTLQFVATGDTDAAPLAKMIRHGDELMHRITDAIEQITATQQRSLLDRREAAVGRARMILVAEVASGIVSATCAIVILAVLLGRGRERKHVAQLRRLNNELGGRVAERTAELGRSEARQRGYFDHSPIGMIVMSRRADGQLVHADLNPASEVICACSRDAVIGRTLEDVWPEPVAKIIAEKMAACILSGKPLLYSLSDERHGAAHHLDFVIVALAAQPGESPSVLACVQDVTMKRELERQLVIHAEQQAEAAEREVAFFRNSVDILFVADVEDHDDGPEFVYEAVSPAFERITGLPAARLVGHRPDECLTSTTGVSVLAHYFACVETGVMVTYTDSYLLPVGTRDIEGSLTPIRHPSTGKVTRIAGLIRDVTERNQMESALRHTQKMEAIGRLAAGVAHDFNNLLQTMISGLELVLDDVAADTPAFEFADLALKAAHRGASLTRHLLAYARKQMLLPQAVDLNIALYDLQKLLSHVLDPQIAVMVQVDPDMKPAFADPGQLQTALLNLAMNAADAMASGGTLTLSACTTGYAGSEKIALCVSDTGSGMDAATLARAPDPFFTTKGPGGSGLGLSMVKGFAEQSGGDFAISSRPGAGTAVTVQLPCAQAAAAPPAAALLPRVSGRILLVDDASDVLVTTSAFLEKAGFSVVRAKDGTDALARLASGDHFDALVTDFAMPGMNGVDLIAEGRLIHPHLPALIITGFAEVRGQAELPDGVPVLRKPLTRLDLLKTIQQVTPAVIVR